MEISLCKFIGTCLTDLKQIFGELNEESVDDNIKTKIILKESIKLHQEMLKYEDLKKGNSKEINFHFFLFQ